MPNALHNLDRLAAFVSAVESKSLTRAAQELFLTQPCVSKYVKALEEMFDLRLIERGPRGIEPTEAGSILYQLARNLLLSAEGLGQAMSEYRDAKVGRLSIGASVITADYLLPSILGRFKLLNPGAEIAMRTGISEDIFQAVQDGEIQIGITACVSSPKDLEVEVLCTDEIVLVVSPHHVLSNCSAITLEQLAQHGILYPPARSYTWEVVTEVLDRASITPRGVMELGHPEAVKRAVEQGVGVALVCRIVAERELSDGTLHEVKIEGVTMPVEYKLIYNPLLYQSPVLRHFLSFLRSELSGS